MSFHIVVHKLEMELLPLPALGGKEISYIPAEIYILCRLIISHCLYAELTLILVVICVNREN